MSTKSRHVERRDDGVSVLLRRFFVGLERTSFEWAVLRDGQPLPAAPANDIDLLVEPGHVDRVAEVLRGAMSSTGWRLSGAQHRLGYRCWMLRRGDRFLQIDVFEDVLLGWGRLANAAFVRSRRRRNAHGIWCVDSGPAEAVRLLKEIARGHEVASRHRENILRAAMSDPSGFVGAFAPCLRPLAPQILAAVTSEDWVAVAEMGAAVRRRVLTSIEAVYTARWASWGRALARSVWAREMSALVVVIGPDGSGKTTVAEGVAEVLDNAPFRAARLEAFGFQILPEMKVFKRPITKLMGMGMGRDARLPNHDDASELHSGMRGRIEPTPKLMVQAAYYAVDFALGRAPLSRWFSKGQVVLFARYFDDYYFQRAFARVPSRYLDLLSLVVPRPDLVVFLDRDAQDIYDQKPELTVEEIERQQRIIRSRFSRASDGAVLVDASGGVNPTVATVAELIRRLVEHRSYW